jgi:hypothetical protein
MNFLLNQGQVQEKEIQGEKYYRFHENNRKGGNMDFQSLEQLKNVLRPYAGPASGSYQLNGNVVNVRVDILPIPNIQLAKTLIGTVPFSQEAQEFFASKNWHQI